MICSTTSCSVNLNQAGAFLEYGVAEEEIPLPYNMLVNSTFKAKAQNYRTIRTILSKNPTYAFIPITENQAHENFARGCPNNLTLQ